VFKKISVDGYKTLYCARRTENFNSIFAANALEFEIPPGLEPTVAMLAACFGLLNGVLILGAGHLCRFNLPCKEALKRAEARAPNAGCDTTVHFVPLHPGPNVVKLCASK
jgi:hypothetical protein